MSARKFRWGETQLNETQYIPTCFLRVIAWENRLCDLLPCLFRPFKSPVTKFDLSKHGGSTRLLLVESCLLHIPFPAQPCCAPTGGFSVVSHCFSHPQLARSLPMSLGSSPDLVWGVILRLLWPKTHSLSGLGFNVESNPSPA
jgi:hypothetical protein